jgi:hypothetical protein
MYVINQKVYNYLINYTHSCVLTAINIALSNTTQKDGSHQTFRSVPFVGNPTHCVKIRTNEQKNAHNSSQLMSVLENVCVNQVQLCAYAYGSHTIEKAHSTTAIIPFWKLL